MIRTTFPGKDYKLAFYLVFSLLALVIAWPDFGPYYEPGIDGSIVWVFNHLFASGLEAGKHIVFPHGPLAFVMYPVPFEYNLEIALSFRLLLSLLLVYHSYRLARDQSYFWFYGPVLIWLMLSLANLQLLLLLVLASALLSLLQGRSLAGISLSLALVALALFIKSYVGILALALFLAFNFLNTYQSRRLLPSLLNLAVLTGMLLVIWYFMYGELAGIGRYFYGLLQLAGDNSTAVSYYPNNNWWLLGAFMIVFFLPLLLWRDEKLYLFFLLLLPALFAGWKHGMSRQDVFHTGQLLRLLLLCGLLSLVYLRHWQKLAAIFILSGSGLFYLNARAVEGFQDFQIDLWQADHLVEQFSDFQVYKERHLALSREKCAVNELDQSEHNFVGNETTDSYPWDYSVIPANNLNWQPRPVLQSYAAYSSWLDQQNAAHFTSAEAPKVLLWETKKMIQARYGEELSSVDWRYLLNDEPQTMLEVFQHYARASAGENRFQRMVRTKPKPGQIELQRHSKSIIAWDTWLPVPQKTGTIQRLKLQIKPSLWGRIRSFLYKAGEVYIYYQLEDKSILSYKIVPKNATNGLWLNPFLTDFENQLFPDRVTAVKFRTSIPSLLADSLEVEFEEITMDAPLLGCFGGGRGRLQRYESDGEGYPAINRGLWDLKYKPDTSRQRIGKDEFLAIWQCKLDTFNHPISMALRLDLEADISGSRYQNAVAVVSIQHKGENLLWQQRPLSDFIIRADSWNYFRGIWELSLPVDLVTEVSGNRAEDVQLKVFFWNPGEVVMEIRPRRLRIANLSNHL